jgi:DNA-binding NtrC family response regulator
VATTLSPVRAAVEDVLFAAGMFVEFTPSIPSEAELQSSGALAVICTPDVDWKVMVRRCGSAVPVILLLQSGEADLWAKALINGAFDAVTFGADPGRLLETVNKAMLRRDRVQRVRHAQERNPLGGTTAARA